MTALVWDRNEDRRYETGIERGLLCPVDGAPVVWNGLISVAETKGRETKDYYQDGVRVLQRLIAPVYAAKISAFTYPDALDELAGNLKLAPGVDVHDQREGQFHLAYRTRIGSALEGPDHGYKLHLIYNVVANPDDTTHETISDSPSAAAFGWTISGAQTLWGTKPVNHISIDSTEVDPAKLAVIENALYGTSTSDPYFIDRASVLGMF
jgi:hypothetical protein